MNTRTSSQSCAHRACPSLSAVQCLELLSHDLNSDVQSTLSVAQVQAQIAMALAGLAHLHKLCIVHADLKEDNLLMSHTGELKIADFGTAQRLPPKELCMSKMGTPVRARSCVGSL